MLYIKLNDPAHGRQRAERTVEKDRAEERSCGARRLGL